MCYNIESTGHKFGESNAGFPQAYILKSYWEVKWLNVYWNMSNIKLMMNTKATVQLFKKN